MYEALKKRNDLADIRGTFPLDWDTEKQLQICIGEKTLTGDEISQKMILKSLAEKVKDFSKYLLKETDSEEERLGICRQITKLTIDSKRRSFLFEYFNGITYANKDYKRFKVKASAKCTYCTEPIQSFDHLFITCETVREFRETLEIREFRIPKALSAYERRFGCKESAISSLNFEILYYIRWNNYWDKKLRVDELMTWLKNLEAIEEKIAEKRDKVTLHRMKWDTIRNYT